MPLHYGEKAYEIVKTETEGRIESVNKQISKSDAVGNSKRQGE